MPRGGGRPPLGAAAGEVRIDRAANLVEVESGADAAALRAAIIEEGYETEILNG